MQKLVVCDIDGCLNSGKREKLDLETLVKVGEHLEYLREQHDVHFTLCTGRPQPYAEALGTMLGVRLPMICEYGAVMYDPISDQATALAAGEAIKDISKAKIELSKYDWFGTGNYIEFGKEFSFSVVGPSIEIKNANELEELAFKIQSDFSDLDIAVTCSLSSIDFMPSVTNKGTSITALIDAIGLRPKVMIGIGDSLGDLSFLELMDVAMCPSNAAQPVKNLAAHIASETYAVGTLELLKSTVVRD